MNAASRLSHIPHVCRRAALLAALVAALAQPAWAQNTNSGGHVEQDGSDYIYVGDTSPVTIASPKAEYGGTTVTLNHVYGGKSDAADVKGWNLTLKGTAVVVDNAYGGWIGGSSDLVSENLVRLEGGAEVGSPSLPGANSDGGNVYGGYSANQYKAATADAATNNTVVLAENAQVFSGNSSPQQNGHVFGGYAVTGSVAHNKVRIEGGGTPGTGGVWVEGSVTANHAADGSATGSNDLDQPDVSIEAGGIGNVIGGASDASDGNVTGHVVKIAGGEVVGNIYGGLGNGGNIRGNIIVLAGGKVSGNIYGGFGNSGNIQDNTIVLAGEANLDNSTLYGHDGGGTGMQNTLRVEVKNEQVQAVQNFDTWHFALPGDLQPSNDPSQPTDIMLKVTNQGSPLDIDGDRVTVSTDGNLALGLNERAVLLSLEDKQRVTVNYTNPPTTLPTARLDGESAGLPALVYALDTASAPDENQLAIFLEEKYLYGSGGTNSPGQREQGNTLTLTGGEATAAFGGRALNGDVRGNTLIIDGAATLKPLDPSHPSYDLSGKAYGGYADAGNATGNTVTLSSNMSGQAAGFALYGGFSGNGGEATSGNTLQVQGSEVTVPAINNFETLSLTLPAGIATGNTMLNVSGAAEFPAAATTVNIALAPGAKLNVGNKITLVAAGTLAITLAHTTITSGGYEFALDASDGKNLFATVTKVPPPSGATAVPTMGGAGLALTSMALAGAAVPALRRRRKQAKRV